MFFYPNGISGSSLPIVSVQKQSTEKLIRMFLEIKLLNLVYDSEKVRLKSNIVSCVSLASQVTT